MDKNEYIKELRAKTGMTGQEFAEATGLKRQGAISQIENNHKHLGYERFVKIVNAMGGEVRLIASYKGKKTVIE